MTCIHLEGTDGRGKKDEKELSWFFKFQIK